jgi:hypothetical protein
MMFRAVFCLLPPSLMMEAVRTSETSVDNHSTRQYNPEDSSEHNKFLLLSTATHGICCTDNGDQSLST